jgi:hypothetical protein
MSDKSHTCYLNGKYDPTVVYVICGHVGKDKDDGRPKWWVTEMGYHDADFAALKVAKLNKDFVWGVEDSSQPYFTYSAVRLRGE